MDYTHLRNKVNLWPHMHFSGALYEIRGALCEIYATDTSRKHVSRIFLFCIVDEHEAGEMCIQVAAWLEKINRGRDEGKPMVVPSDTVRKAVRLRSWQASRDDARNRE